MPTIDHVSGVFPGATVAGTDLVIPLAAIPTFDGVMTAGSNGGAECVLGLLDAIASTVTPLASGGFTRNETTNFLQNLSSNSGLLSRTYTITASIGLDLGTAQLDLIPPADPE